MIKRSFFIAPLSASHASQKREVKQWEVYAVKNPLGHYERIFDHGFNVSRRERYSFDYGFI